MAGMEGMEGIGGMVGMAGIGGMELAMAENDPSESEARSRAVLAELGQGANANLPGEGSPPATSPDELMIQLRGPRRKPVTWSPIDCSKLCLLVPQKTKSPEKVMRREVRPGLRRRLTLSPEKNLAIQPSNANGSSSNTVLQKKLKKINFSLNKTT